MECVHCKAVPFGLRKRLFCVKLLTDGHTNTHSETYPHNISAATTDTFNRRLDKFWQHQDILYDYKVELTGVGNRSQINTDDNIVLYVEMR